MHSIAPPVGNRHATGSLATVGRLLTDVCMGREQADLIITGGRLVNVHTREIHDNASVAIKAGRIAMFGDVDHTVGADTDTIDANGAFLVPGMIDTHIHVESALVTVAPFAEAVLRHGTTAILLENHDMANVFGMEGMRWMVDEAQGLPLKVLYAPPSCVPPSSAERSGATVAATEIREALAWPGAAALGEMMNMTALIDGDPALHDKVAAALQAGVPVTGHWSLSGDNDHRLQAYAAAGVDCCHESINREDALAKLRAGMWVQIREGSAWHDTEAVVEIITKEGMDPRHVMLIADDMQPQSLVPDGPGHMNNAVRIAIQAGLDPLVAIQLATINPAEYLGRRADLGSIAPGRCADILFVEDLREMRPHLVMTDGVVVDRVESSFQYPAHARDSVHLPAGLGVADLRITADGDRAQVRAIGMVPDVVPTESRVVETRVVDGAVPAAPEIDLAKVANISRHAGQTSIGLGFIQGLGLRRGAIAQTAARDAHHLLAIGMNDDDMLYAVEQLRRVGGGMAVVEDGQTLALVELPIAGLVSDKSVPEVAAEVAELISAYRQLGCRIEHAFMVIALLSVSAIPELRITNRGLIDPRTMEFLDAVVSAA